VNKRFAEPPTAGSLITSLTVRSTDAPLCWCPFSLVVNLPCLGANLQDPQDDGLFAVVGVDLHAHHGAWAPLASVWRAACAHRHDAIVLSQAHPSSELPKRGLLLPPFTQLPRGVAFSETLGVERP
jgi:hypothetical protein